MAQLKTDTRKKLKGKFQRTVQSRKVIPLTKARAKQYADMPTFEEERNLNPAWAQSLRDLMAVGLFLPELARIISTVSIPVKLAYRYQRGLIAK